MTSFLSDNYLPEIMTYARQAQSAWLWINDTAVDQILSAVLDGILPFCSDLSRSSAEETRMGIFEDKLVYLNRTLNDIREQYLPCHTQESLHLARIDTRIEHQPIGIIAGITDIFHPAASVIYSCLTAIRTRNPIILSFHPSAYGCSYAAATAVRDLAVSAGAPDNCIQWLDESNPEIADNLLRHHDIAAVIASGHHDTIRQYLSIYRGPCAVTYPSAAFCYIHQSADIHYTVRQLLLSRTFDNSLSNCSEQIICIDRAIYTAFKDILQSEGCYMASSDEITRMTAVLVDMSNNTANPAVIGQTPQTIAALADITIPEDTRLIAMEMDLDQAGHPLLVPFLCPAVVLVPVGQTEQAIEKIKQLSTISPDFSTDLLMENIPALPKAHSLAVYCENMDLIRFAAHALPEFSLIENAPAAGQSLTSQFISRYGGHLNAGAMEQLLSFCRYRHELPDIPHTFRFPAALHFQKGALQYLNFADYQTQIVFLYHDSESSQTAVTPAVHRIQNRYPALKYHHLKILKDTPGSRLSDYLLPQLTAASPDCLIAIGNNQIMNIAKMLISNYRALLPDHSVNLILIPSIEGCHTAILPFYDYYDASSDNLIERFIPNEPFTVIADTNLHPTPETETFIPACLAAMADAFDACLSNRSDDLTDALSMQAISLFLKWLPEIFHNESKASACLEHLQNACLLSGQAAAHTGIGLSRIMAGRLYCDFHISPITLQALLLPHILRYNGEAHPAKHGWHRPASGYSISGKLQHLCIAAGQIDLASPITSPASALSEIIRNFLHSAGIPLTIKDCGIREKDYMMRTDTMARKTFEQLSTSHADENPRYPLIKELTQLYKQLY